MKPLAKDERIASANRLRRLAVIAGMASDKWSRDGARDGGPDMMLTALTRELQNLRPQDMNPICEVKTCGRSMTAGVYTIDGADGPMNVCSIHAAAALKERGREDSRRG